MLYFNHKFKINNSKNFLFDHDSPSFPIQLALKQNRFYEAIIDKDKITKIIGYPLSININKFDNYIIEIDFKENNYQNINKLTNNKNINVVNLNYPDIEEFDFDEGKLLSDYDINNTYRYFINLYQEILKFDKRDYILIWKINNNNNPNVPSYQIQFYNYKLTLWANINGDKLFLNKTMEDEIIFNTEEKNLKFRYLTYGMENVYLVKILKMILTNYL